MMMLCAERAKNRASLPQKRGRDERENRHADIFPHTEPDPRDAKFPQLEEINPKINKKKEKQRRGWAVAHSALPSLHDTGGKKMWNTRKPKTVKNPQNTFRTNSSFPYTPELPACKLRFRATPKRQKRSLPARLLPKKIFAHVSPQKIREHPRLQKPPAHIALPARNPSKVALYVDIFFFDEFVDP
jgi:hypothetical protein